MRETFKRLSVIIPVYEDRSSVGEVVETVLAVDVPLDLDVIVVAEGPIESLAEDLDFGSDVPVRIVSRSEGSGKGKAVRTGLTIAKGDVILIQDADVEFDPKEYILLLAPILAKETNVVFGSRALSAGAKGNGRGFADKLITTVANLLFSVRLTDVETSYKAFTIDVAENLVLRADGVDIEPEITVQIARLGVAITEVPCSYQVSPGSMVHRLNLSEIGKALKILFRGRFVRKYSGRRKIDAF